MNTVHGGVLSLEQEEEVKVPQKGVKQANAWALPHPRPQTERDKQQNEADRLLRVEPLAAWPVQPDE